MFLELPIKCNNVRKEKEVCADTKNRSWLGEVFYMPIQRFFYCSNISFEITLYLGKPREVVILQSCRTFETISTEKKWSANNIAKIYWKLWKHLTLMNTKLFSIKLAWQDVIAINYVLNHSLNLLLILVHVKHHIFFVAGAMLVSLGTVSSAIRLLRMLYFTSARYFTWMSMLGRLCTSWVIPNCLPSLAKEIGLLLKLYTIRIVLKNYTVNTEVTTTRISVKETTWWWFITWFMARAITWFSRCHLFGLSKRVKLVKII